MTNQGIQTGVESKGKLLQEALDNTKNAVGFVGFGLINTFQAVWQQ